MIRGQRVSGDIWWGRGVWFRVYGWGVSIHLRRTHKVYFSERYGYQRWRYFGPICWRGLKP